MAAPPLKKIKIVKNSLLREHEKINKSHFQKLLQKIKKDGFIKNPIIADEQSNIILDGHHRFHILKHLGYLSVPVFFVDYQNRKIKVASWRKGEKVRKEDVLQAGLTNKLFRPKTSRHTIPGRPMNIRIPLEKFA